MLYDDIRYDISHITVLWCGSGVVVDDGESKYIDTKDQFTTLSSIKCCDL